MIRDLVSIIVPVYNVEKYLDECINSLIHQTYPQIEILLIDDGSTDNSSYKCNQWAEIEQRITVYHKKNEGLGLTRNYGIERAKGQFILFIDSDDYVKSDMVEKMIAEQKKNDADTVIAGWQRVLDGRIVYFEKYSYKVYCGSDNKYKLLPRFVGSRPDGKDGLFQTACAKLYSVDVIRNNNLKFVSEREYQGEDMVFQLDYFQHCKKTVVSEDMPYFYRVNTESLTKSYKPARFQNSKKMYNYVEKKLTECGIDEKEKVRLGKLFFVQIYAALIQEVPKVNGKTIKQSILNVTDIVHDDIVDKALKGYPVKLLTFKQRCFFYMLKYKKIYLLYLYLLFQSFI